MTAPTASNQKPQTYYTFSAPKKEPPDRETPWKRLIDEYCYPTPLKFDIHELLQQLKLKGTISQYAVVELVIEDQ